MERELVMNSKAMQWVLWAILMGVFTALTLSARWLDLALALTVAAVFWYGIVPEPTSRDNDAAGGATVRKR